MASSKNGTITFTAQARYGYAGKQFVARIVGRDPKFTFAREFLGRKTGKRGEDTIITVDEAGLYMERDVDSKGRATDSYYVVFNDPAGGVDYVPVEHTDAMKLAKLTTAEIDAEGRALEVARLAFLNEKQSAEDQEEVVLATATYEGVTEGERYPRRVIVAARAQRIAQLRGNVTEAAVEPVEAQLWRAREAIRAVLALDGQEGNLAEALDALRPQLERALES